MPSTPLERAVARLRRSGKFLAWRPEAIDFGYRSMLAGDKHFTPAELAKAWGVSAETIRSIFRKEQGVLKIGQAGTKSRRGYFLIRIPEDVAERVHRRLGAVPQ